MNRVARICVSDFFGLDEGRAFRSAFPHRELRTLVPNLQSAQVMDEIPSFFRLNDVGKRRHLRTVNTRQKDLIEIAVGGAALEAVAGVEIVGFDGLIIAVGKSAGRRTVATTFRSMTFPAFQLLVQL